MAEHDDIKKRFGDGLKARQDADQAYRVRAAEAAEKAFAPIIQTVEAMAEAVNELGDSGINIKLHHPSLNRNGDYEIKVFFNRVNTTKQVIIRLVPAIGHGDHFWIAGLDGDARKQLNGEVNISNPAEVSVPADRVRDVAAALETFGVGVLGA